LYFFDLILAGAMYAEFYHNASPPMLPWKALIGFIAKRGPISISTSLSISSAAVNFSSC